MRRAVVAVFVVLAGCPKDKPKTCVPLTTERLNPGQESEPIRFDVCGVGAAGRNGGGENYIAWWSLAPGLFSIPELPWYLSMEFREVTVTLDDGTSANDPELIIKAHENAPRGIFAGRYEYQLNLNSATAPQGGDVRIEVHHPVEGMFIDFSARVTGDGSIQNDIIQCGSTGDRCAASYRALTDDLKPFNEPILMEVLPDAGWTFASVDCGLSVREDNGRTFLEGTATENLNCEVTFVPDNGNMLLNIDIDGGSGAVTVDFGQSVETLTEQESFSLEPGSQVTLTAVDVAPFEFDSWLGDCAGGSREVQVTLDAHKSCTAHFVRTTIEGHALNVMIEGQGWVRIGDEAPCNAEAPCATYPASPGEVVSLVATPADQWTFMGWSGDCAGNNPSISVTVNSVLNCTATFMAGDCGGAPVAGRVALLDDMGAEIGSSLDGQCVYTVGSGQSFTLSARDFISNVPLAYAWDPNYTDDANYVPNFTQHFGQTISLTLPHTGCRGIMVRATNMCGESVTQVIGLRF